MPRPLRVAIASALLLVGTASAVHAAKEPPKPAAVPPEVSLALTAGSAAWTLEVANLGSVPMQLEADARLLRLELAPLPPSASASASASVSASPKGKAAPKPPKPPPNVVCELPASMRLEGRTLVLKPGQRYVESFDPRLLCLDASAKLDAGARVTATLGWPAGKGALVAPFVVAPFVTASASPSASTSTSSAPRIASAKEIAAPPFVLAPRVVASSSPASIASVSSSAAPKPVAPKPALTARGGSARSVYSGKDAEVAIVVTNDSPNAQSVYARPQTIGVLVRGPRGERTRCELGLMPAPIVDFVVRLAPGGTWTSATRIEGLCPRGTFDRPGIYELWPVLHAPALPWQPSAFAGDVRATAPQLLRVETGKLPFHDAGPRAAPSVGASASAKP